MILNQNTTQELEQNLIRAIIENPKSLSDVMQTIEADDFESERLKGMFLAIIRLYNNNDDITPYGVLESIVQLGFVCGQEEALLVSMPPPIDPPITIARIIRQNSVSRKILQLSKDIPSMINENPNTISILSNIITTSEGCIKRMIPPETETFADRVRKRTEKIMQKEADVSESIIPTPYNTLNKYIGGGLMDTELIAVCARPGIGKTVVAINFIEHACKMGKKVLFFSLEMSTDSNIDKLVACHGDILLNHMNAGASGRTDEIIKRIDEASKEVEKWHLNIKEDPMVTMDHIKAIAEKEKDTNGLDMLVIDYLQLITPTSKRRGGTRQEEVAEISRSAKLLAKSLHIPVIILAQINREEKGDDGTKLPTLADIKESGAIAADSDIVLLLHRRKGDDSTDPKATFILAKNRRGPADRIFKMRSIMEKTKFQDLLDEDTSSKTKEETEKPASTANSNGWGNPNDIADQETFTEEDFDNLFNDDEEF